jgi:hypothetical protein
VTQAPVRRSQGLTVWVCVWCENISQKLRQITPFETLEMANLSTNCVPNFRTAILTYSISLGTFLTWHCPLGAQRKWTEAAMNIPTWTIMSLLVLARAVNRRPYEPYVRYRHTVPSAVPVDFWNCDYRSRYTAGSQPYFAVL